MFNRSHTPLLLSVLLLVTLGCMDSSSDTAPEATSRNAAPQIDKFKVKDASDVHVMTVKFKEYGFAFYDTSGATLAKMKRDGDRWKIKDAQSQGLFKIKPKEGGGCKLASYDSQTLVTVKPKGDKWELRDGEGNTWAVLKPKGTSWKADDPAGTTMVSVKIKSGKCTVLDGQDNEILKVADVACPLGCAILGLDKLPILQRYALYCKFRDSGN